MTRSAQADYRVAGTGPVGMADALLEHADVRVAIVERRDGAGGHWLDADPFVRLHQASAFYGATSTGPRTPPTSRPRAGQERRRAV